VCVCFVVFVGAVGVWLLTFGVLVVGVCLAVFVGAAGVYHATFVTTGLSVTSCAQAAAEVASGWNTSFFGVEQVADVYAHFYSCRQCWASKCRDL
jgi:hypothetical protein